MAILNLGQDVAKKEKESRTVAHNVAKFYPL